MKINIKLDPRSKLHAASRLLDTVGIKLQVDSLSHQVTLEQIGKLSVYGQEEAAQLVNVINHMNAFDELVTENMKEMNVGDRHEEIIENFSTIIKDLERKVRTVSKNDGEQSLVGKIQDKIVRWRRGDISDRFNRNKQLFEAVFKDADEQISRERKILEAYGQYRQAVHESLAFTEILKERATEERNRIAERYKEAQEMVSNASDDLPPLQLHALRVNCDNIRMEFEKVDELQNIAASLTEKMTLSYAVSESVMARYATTAKTREDIQQQSALYFSTNKGMMSTLHATLRQLEAMAETKGALNAYQDGNKNLIKGLTSSTSVMSKIAKEATEAAYASVITPEDLRKLYESTVTFKTQQAETIAKARRQREESLKAVNVEMKRGQDALAKAELTVIDTLVNANYSANQPTNQKTMAVEIDVPQMSAKRVKEHQVETGLGVDVSVDLPAATAPKRTKKAAP